MQINGHRIAAVVLSIVAAILTTGCAGPDRGPKSQVDYDAWAAIGYRLAWEGYPEMGRPNGRVKFFDLFDDVVVVHDTTNIVSVLEAESGVRRWSDKPGANLTKFVGNARWGNRLYVSSESEVFIYDVETSTLVDKQQLARVVNTRPIIAGDVLVYGTSGGFVLGHQVTTAINLWTNSFMDQSSVEADPVMVSNLTGLVSRAGGVMFLDPLAMGSSSGRARIFGGTAVDLAASDTLMYVASTDHSLYAISAVGAQQVWRRRTGAPLMHAPTHIAGRVFCTLPGAGLTALHADTGRVYWSADQIEGTVIGLRDDNLLVWDAPSQTMTVVDPEDGSLVNRVALKGVQDVIASQTADGDLYVVWPRGIVARFVPRG